MRGRSSVADADAGVFDTTTVMVSASACALTVILPPRLVNLIALETRLSMIWFSARLSAIDVRQAVGKLDDQIDSDLARLEPRRSQHSSITCRGANGSGVISKLPDSIFDMSRMPLTTDSR